MTRKMYLADRAIEGTTAVTALVTGDRLSVRLRETWFHPQGGGQRGDRGWIGGARVVDTRHAADGEVDHIVDSFATLTVGAVVSVAIDSDHRQRSARLHSAGHLLTEAVQVVRPALKAVAGHHWEGEARVEFEGACDIDDHLREDIERVMDELIAADLGITVTGDPFVARTIQIGDFAPVGCGGTHVVSTGILSGMGIAGVKRKGDRLRISYHCS